MPFTGKDYDEIVLNNLESKIDCNFDKMGIQITKECCLNSPRSYPENVG